MTAPAPADFADQTAGLLFDHVRSVEDRRALIDDAFLTTYTPVTWDINLDAPSPRAFAYYCLKTLATQPEGDALVTILLITLRRRYGEPQYSQINRLLPAVPTFCAKLRAAVPPPADPPPGPPRDDLATAQRLIAGRFNDSELRDLCLDLAVDYDDLPPGGKSAKARELVLYLNRRGRIADLAAAVTSLQPDITWPVPIAQPELRARPVVFLSYADEEREAAQRLAAELTRHGHAVDLARGPAERGGDAWLTATAETLSNAYAVILLAGERTADDRWTRLELLAALDKRKTIVPVLLPAGRLPAFMPADLAPAGYQDGAPEALLRRLPAPPSDPPATGRAALSPAQLERLRELRYLDRLKLDELRHVAQYTRLGGESHLRRSRSDRLELPLVVARQELIHARWRRGRDLIEHVEERRFEDAVPELKAIGRAVLLGEPGSGKTTTLFKLAADLADAALFDPTAPVPLLVRLGLWTDAGEPFDAFLRRAAAELGDGLPARLAGRRAALLLDGLNEIPSDQQAGKYHAVDRFLAAHPALPAVVTCREQDYPADRALALDRVTVAPLDPARVSAFIHSYLDPDPDHGPAAADDLFWQLAGAGARSTYDKFQSAFASRLSDQFSTFWLAGDLPDGLQWGYTNYFWTSWLQERAQPASLLLLAQNPYMLAMLLDVYRRAGDHALPANRGELFDSFVEILLLRERLFRLDPATGGVVRRPAGEALLDALTELAYEMQRRRVARKGDGGALTALPQAEATRFLDEAQRHSAASANLLTPGPAVRFAHQLLQEYFVARAMRDRIFGPAGGGAQRLRADTIWPPDRWWQPTNWEEATTLLAGLTSDDCTAVVDWVADANPEVAARCLTESGARAPEATRLALRQRWQPRLTDLRRDPDARARAAVGRALGRLALDDGTPLDNRPGIGIIVRHGLRIPDIAWGEPVPAGDYTIGGDKDAGEPKRRRVPIARPFQLARYPVTYAQFDCFVRAPDFADERWWAGMPAEEEAYGTTYRLRELSEQAFPFANHPRERISWYQAIAFARWLSDRLGEEIDLPHEYEWEVAARYPDGRLFPWGKTFDPAKANTTEGDSIGQTSAVGIYPQGANPAPGLFDLSGNVWEWCRNKVEEPDDAAVDGSGARRVVRGGSWRYLQGAARAAYRYHFHPSDRLLNLGCRVVRRPPSQAL